MSTITSPPHTLHGALISALTGPDPEAALEQAFVQLNRGADLPLVLAIIRALVRLGVGGVALRLLRASSGLLAAEPQLASLAEQLERVPSGEMPRHQWQSQFQRNMNALQGRDPALYDCLVRTSAEAQCRIYVSSKGNYYLLRGDVSGPFDPVFSIADHVARAAALPLPPISVGSGYLVIGVPPPALWQRLIDSRTSDHYEPPIDVVETDLNVLRLWLGLVDLAVGLQNERISLFAGDEAREQYRQFLLHHPTRQPATECLTNPRPRWQPPTFTASFTQAVLRANASAKKRRKTELDNIYKHCDSAYWRNRFRSAGSASAPLRIVGFTTRYSTVIQHSMRDLAAAFRRLGCEFHVIKQDTSSSAAVDVIGSLTRVQPDLIVVINHLRSELLDSIPDNIPYVCWIQDHMPQLCTTSAGQSVGDFDLVLGHSPDVMTSVYEYPVEQFIQSANLTSPDIFSNTPCDPASLEPYRCDISYIGHGSATPERLIQKIGAGNTSLIQYLSEILNLARATLDEHAAFTTQDLVDTVLHAERRSGHAPLPPTVRRSVIIPAAQQIFDRLLRHQTLTWAANWADQRGRTFRIFGRGWEKHPQFARFACGEIDHGEALRRCYQASNISLQVNAYGSLHQRLLDGLMSGGFLVSRYVPADFIRSPFEAIRQFIHNSGICSLGQLMSAACANGPIAAAVSEAELLTGTRIAAMSDPQRAAHVKSHIACSSLSPKDFSDQGLFDLLRKGKGVPYRTAADILGFTETTFRTERELHELLDRFVDDRAARRQLAGPMRDSVLQHDTYDGLAARVLATFRDRWR